MPRAKALSPAQEAVQAEADTLLDYAQALEDAAKETRRDAAALRAHARGLKPGEAGLLPGWGYDYLQHRAHMLKGKAESYPNPNARGHSAR